MQKLLSCIYRVGQQYAAGYVINVLRGKADDWITRNGHEQLSTFGIGAGLTDKNWRNIIRQCIGQNLIAADVSHHQALMLTPAALPVLKGEQSVMLRPLKREKAATQSGSLKSQWLRTEREERIWQALRQWRLDQARSENIAAYMICGDKTLQDIIRQQPRTLADLPQIYGLGDAKIAKYGQAILDVYLPLNGQEAGG